MKPAINDLSLITPFIVSIFFGFTFWILEYEKEDFITPIFNNEMVFEYKMDALLTPNIIGDLKIHNIKKIQCINYRDNYKPIIEYNQITIPSSFCNFPGTFFLNTETNVLKSTQEIDDKKKSLISKDIKNKIQEVFYIEERNKIMKKENHLISEAEIKAAKERIKSFNYVEFNDQNMRE